MDGCKHGLNKLEGSRTCKKKTQIKQEHTNIQIHARMAECGETKTKNKPTNI